MVFFVRAFFGTVNYTSVRRSRSVSTLLLSFWILVDHFECGELSFDSRMSDLSTDLERICADALSPSTYCISDDQCPSTYCISDDQSVDFGTLISDRETPKLQCFGYANANDSFQECYYTEKTKHYASQTTYSNQTSRKKRQRSLELLEPERYSSSSSFNLQDIEDGETLDLLNGKHLYAGREIFSRYILQFVRNAFYIVSQ